MWVDDWIQIYHPDLPYTQKGPGKVTRRSFDETWAIKGWLEWPPPSKVTKKQKQEETTDG